MTTMPGKLTLGPIAAPAKRPAPLASSYKCGPQFAALPAPKVRDLRRYTHLMALLADGEYKSFPYERWERVIPIGAVVADELDDLIKQCSLTQFPHNTFSRRCPEYAVQVVYFDRQVRVTLADFGSEYGGDALAHPDDWMPTRSAIPTDEQIKKARRHLAMSVPKETP